MLDNSKYLLFCLAEEAGEVAQAVGKIGRFGINTYKPNGDTNFNELKKEMADLMAVWELYCDEVGENFVLDYTHVYQKQQRIRAYMDGE